MNMSVSINYLAINVQFAIQHLISRPHSKWRWKCYHDDQAVLNNVYYRAWHYKNIT